MYIQKNLKFKNNNFFAVTFQEFDEVRVKIDFQNFNIIKIVSMYFLILNCSVSQSAKLFY